jgi:hypothetical protein
MTGLRPGAGIKSLYQPIHRTRYCWLSRLRAVVIRRGGHRACDIPLIWWTPLISSLERERCNDDDTETGVRARV